MLNNRLANESIPSGNVTLRFDGQTLESLRKEAEQKRISLNTLASQIFKTHTEFSGAAAKAGMVSFPKSLLVRLMDKLSEDEVKRLSEEIAKNEMKDTLLMISEAIPLKRSLTLLSHGLEFPGLVTRTMSQVAPTILPFSMKWVGDGQCITQSFSNSSFLTWEQSGLTLKRPTTRSLSTWKYD